VSSKTRGNLYEALAKDFGKPAMEYLEEHFPGLPIKSWRRSLTTLFDAGHPEVTKSVRQVNREIPKEVRPALPAQNPPTPRHGQSTGAAAKERLVRVYPKPKSDLEVEFGAANLKRATDLDPTATPAELRQTLENFAVAGAPNVRVPAEPRTLRVDPAALAGEHVRGIEKRGGELVDAIPNTSYRVTPKRYDDVKPFNLEDHEGKYAIISMADKSAGGDTITHINDVELNNPVERLGGQEYIHDPHSPDAVWANDDAGVTKHEILAQKARLLSGQDPLLMPFTMSHEGINFSHMPRTGMLAYEAATGSPYHKQQLTQKIRDIVGDEFRDMDDPDSIRAFMQADTPAKRKALNLLLHNQWETGGLGLGPSRLIMSDPTQLSVPMLDLNHVGTIDARAPRVQSNHPSFMTGLPGTPLGQLEHPLAALSMLPEEMADWGLTDPRGFKTGVNKDEPSVPWSMQLNPRLTQITDKIIRARNERGYADGGPVRGSLSVFE
jgi:hypothetical protein